MAQYALFSYAWDIVDIGVAAFIKELQQRELNAVSYAAAYHAGKFLRPHGSGKVYFPQDGTVYFQPDLTRYGEIKPTVNDLLADGADPLRELCDDGRLAVNAWLVLLHNTRLGEAHPDLTVRNAFGDRYVYSLCPNAPAAREYAVALCADVTTAYPLSGVTLETPGFLPFVHGFHHEFGLLRQNDWLNAYLGLCFCDHCIASATEAGVDAEALRQRVTAAIEAYLRGEVDFPADMATAFWAADVASDTELARFLRWRGDSVTALVAEVRAVLPADIELAVIPSVARPSAGCWYEGSDLAALGGVTNALELCLYEASVERVRADLWDVQRRLGGTATAKVKTILRPGYPDLDNRIAVIDAVSAVRTAGVDDIGFYNYGLLSKTSLDWIGAALASLD